MSPRTSLRFVRGIDRGNICIGMPLCFLLCTEMKEAVKTPGDEIPPLCQFLFPFFPFFVCVNKSFLLVLSLDTNTFQLCVYEYL